MDRRRGFHGSKRLFAARRIAGFIGNSYPQPLALPTPRRAPGAMDELSPENAAAIHEQCVCGSAAAGGLGDRSKHPTDSVEDIQAIHAIFCVGEGYFPKPLAPESGEKPKILDHPRR